jgi:hypothetical protein
MPTGPGGDRSRRRPLPGVGLRTRRRKLPDQSVAGYTEVTWAEERATRGRDRSAEPGAKTGVGGRTPPLGIPGIGRKAINPITCICISEWRSENQGLSRARRAGKVAGSKAVMPGCMRLRRTTCAALMVLQKRPCFCSPAARPDICPDLRGETAQHRAKPCPLISAKPCPLISALFLGEDLSASAGWHALGRGEDDTGNRRERHTKMGKQARHALAGHGREIPL